MIETAIDTRYQEAYRQARMERSAAFVGLFKALFGKKDVPLSHMNHGVLTEPSRCA